MILLHSCEPRHSRDLTSDPTGLSRSGSVERRTNRAAHNRQYVRPYRTIPYHNGEPLEHKYSHAESDEFGITYCYSPATADFSEKELRDPA
jgi:hypothetical protein